MSNLSYYCEANHCNSRIKQLVHDYCRKMDQEADIPSLWSLQAEQLNLHSLITELSVKLDKLYRQNSSLKDQVDKISELINVSSDVQPSPGLSSRVENLSEQLSQLQNKVNQILDSLKNINQPLSSFSSSDQDCSTLQSNTAVDLTDEFPDRESRKCNLIVCNLPESPSPSAEADKSFFSGLYNSLGLDAHISTVTRLGKKIPDKIRPLCHLFRQ